MSAPQNAGGSALLGTGGSNVGHEAIGKQAGEIYTSQGATHVQTHSSRIFRCPGAARDPSWGLFSAHGHFITIRNGWDVISGKQACF